MTRAAQGPERECPGTDSLGGAGDAPEQDPFDNPEFARLVIYGLAREWDLAVRFLPSGILAGLSAPGIALQDGRSILGQWVGAPVREIRIAKYLILEHPWYAVVDVLKHEIAHQLAEEVLGSQGQTAHGEAFQQACRMLGANPAASGKGLALDQAVLRQEPDSEEDRILQRVRKLLALAGSPNRHEAERAMEKAHTLMARHHLDVIREDRPREFVSICVGKGALRHSLDAHVLGGLLRDFYFVRTIWIPTFVLEKERIGRILEISGSRSNVQLAEYVYAYVCRVIEVEWQALEAKGRGRNAKRDFALGVLQGFREVLKRRDEKPEMHALVRVPDRRLDDYLATRYRYLRSGSSGRGIRVNHDLVDAGKDVGRNLVIRKGIGEPARNRGRYLG